MVLLPFSFSLSELLMNWTSSEWPRRNNKSAFHFNHDSPGANRRVCCPPPPPFSQLVNFHISAWIIGALNSSSNWVNSGITCYSLPVAGMIVSLCLCVRENRFLFLFFIFYIFYTQCRRQVFGWYLPPPSSSWRGFSKSPFSLWSFQGKWACRWWWARWLGPIVKLHGV